MNIADVKTEHLNALADYTRTLYRAPELRKLFFELTLQCNERCFHCGSSCAPGLANPDDLTREEWFAIIDQVKADFDISRMQLCIRAASRCSIATSSTSWDMRMRRVSAGA